MLKRTRFLVSRHGNASHSAEDAAQRPEKPFLLHQEASFASDGVVIEFSDDEIPVARMWRHADDTFVVVRNSDIHLPSEYFIKESAAD